jgi:putative protease
MNVALDSRLEVLAPAGEMEQLKVAVWHGADAVYLAAKDFGMRSAPANFSFEDLTEAVRFAHEHGVKVYQTVNVLPTNAEVEHLEDFLTKSLEAGVDAIIVSDVGVLMLAKRVVPELEVHISVQMGVVNFLTARELYALGAKRVVLARELTIEEISTIRKNIPEDMEIECFVHGAICMSISGRCLISKYFVDRDANHGECAQPCRWEYDITDPRNPEMKMNVVENMVKDKSGKVVSKGSYILNSKDLNLIEHIADLSEAGVSSLKIEGRAKSSFYVASAVNAYRRAVDWHYQNERANAPLPREILEDVQKISHREYTTGFYFAAITSDGAPIEGAFDTDASPGSYFDKGYKQEWAPAAVKLEDGWHQRGKFTTPMQLEVLVPKQAKMDVIVQKIYALDDVKSRKKGELLQEPHLLESSAHADQLLAFEFTSIDGTPTIDEFPVGTFLRMPIL